MKIPTCRVEEFEREKDNGEGKGFIQRVSIGS